MQHAPMSWTQMLFGWPAMAFFLSRGRKLLATLCLAPFVFVVLLLAVAVLLQN